jgi:hypothetical protein
MEQKQAMILYNNKKLGKCTFFYSAQLQTALKTFEYV